ncbi:MAG: DNA-directed DNA polymerase II small subunit [Candidatus Bathyarchaeota archaeon]|jgi:DNA polymerase II small subunit|nr:DNA-directed DNA polymerase II small subunit [Candidatus Bathyarchaeota archaeon]
MSQNEKLHKAVELTIEAGYQLDKEAFEFLSRLAATEDPTEIVNKAIQRIGMLTEKPLFIGRSFLEELIKEQKPPEEAFLQQIEPSQKIQETVPLFGKGKFHPFAKDIEAHIKVIDNPAEKLSSGGTIEDYLQYFQDRFKRTEKLLRQRMDVKSATSIIEALKSPPNTRLKIIGMVTEKREAKQKILLTVEDLNVNATLLVPQNAPAEVLKKARCLLIDQVVCFSVIKTRSNLLLVEDIILPDIAHKTPHKAQIPVYAVLTSDMHVGSTKFQGEAFNRFLLWLKGEYGNEKMREIASHVKYVLVAGDIVDGIGVYPNQVKELAIKDIDEQYRLAGEFFEQIPEYIEVVIIPGNHDAPRKALPQPPISNPFLEKLQETRKFYSLGNPCTLSLHNVEVLLYHGRSLDDVIPTVPEMDSNQPEKAMKLLLQSRHLAPIYGEKTPISPENRDCLVIERVPDIFHAGHIHALGYTTYRGVLIVNSGGWQEQTEYMRRIGFTPTPGKVPIVNLQTLEVSILSFS